MSVHVPLSSTDLVAIQFERRREEHVAFLDRLTHPPLVTLMILVLLLGIWILEVSSGAFRSPYLLGRYGARVSHLVRGGELWRLITCLGLHSSFDHLLFNGSILLGVGWLAEHLYGPRRFLVLLIGSGVAGGLLGALVDSHTSLGISGAVFGVWGADMVFAHRHWHYLPPRFRHILGWILGLALIYFIGRGLFSTGVDNTAHLSGALVGMIFALVLDSPGLGRDITDQRQVTVAFTSMALGCLFAVASLGRGLHAPDTSTVPRLEGPFTPFNTPSLGFSLSHPVSWERPGPLSEPHFISRVSGVELYVFAGPVIGSEVAVEQLDPVKEIERTLWQAAKQARAQAAITTDAFHPLQVGGLPARGLRLRGLGSDGTGRAALYAVWAGQLRRVVIFMFLTPGPLPDGYDDLFEAIMQSVHWSSTDG